MRNKYLTAIASLVAVFYLCAAAAPATRAQEGPATGQSSKESKEIKEDTGDYYTCPMHPQVKEKKDGSCPVCGMELLLKHAGPKHTDDKINADAHADKSEKSTVTAHAPVSSSKMRIPDVELLDQDGKKVHFYSDLVKGRVVAVQFIFTTCTTICPPLGATFARVQRELSTGAGRDVRFISISVDPATDTPERLKAWGAKFHAADGWTLVTGAKPQIDELLRSLGVATGSPADHTSTVLIGNDAAGQWTRTYGLAPPAVLVKLIGDAVAGRLDSSADSSAKEVTKQ